MTVVEQFSANYSSNLTTVYAADGSSLTTGSQSGSDSASGTADYESEGSWWSHFDYTGSDFSRSETSSGTDTISDSYGYSHSWSVTYNSDGTVTSSDSVSNNVSGGGSRTHTWTTNWTQTQPSAGSSGGSTTGTTGGSTSTTGTTSGSTSTTGSTGSSSTSGSGSTTGTTGTSSPSTVTFSGSDSGSETTDATYADVVLTAGFAGIAYARGPALGLGIADYVAAPGNGAAEDNASGDQSASDNSSSGDATGSQNTSNGSNSGPTLSVAESEMAPTLQRQGWTVSGVRNLIEDTDLLSEIIKRRIVIIKFDRAALPWILEDGSTETEDVSETLAGLTRVDPNGRKILIRSDPISQTLRQRVPSCMRCVMRLVAMKSNVVLRRSASGSNTD